jgi:hypothetical protein
MAKSFKQSIEFDASLRFNSAQRQLLEKALGDSFTPAMVRAARLGGDKMAKRLAKGIEEAADELEAINVKIVAAQKELKDEQDEALKKEIAQRLKLLHKQAMRHKRTMELENKAFGANLDRQEEMLKAYDDIKVKMKVDKKQLAADMGEALTGAFGKLSSGDLSGLASSLGGALSKGGGMMEAAGMAAGGAEAGGMAALAAGLGPLVVGLGATVGALAAIAAVFQMAYDQTKKYNQALAEGAGAADFFSTGAGDMATSLNSMRGAVFNLGRRFRMDTEEIAKFTNALNTSGVTYKEFAGLAGEGKSAQQAFFDVTKTAIVAAKGLGIEAGDAASFMDKSMRDLGKTTLPEMQDAFGAIGSAAARSGMTVKSFFTAISEATSGMALHNIRLEDTIGLMGTMTKVLGEDLAKERVKLEGQFKNMGYQERIKTVMTTGTAKTSKIVGADARAQAAAMSPVLTEAIGKFGGEVGKELTEGGKLNVEMLGKMSGEQFDKLVVGLRATGGDKGVAAARQLENVVKLARGAVSPGDRLAQADAIGQLSKSGELAMQLAGASAVIGKAGKDIQGLDRAAYEQITGLSGENFEIMQRLDRELRGQFGAIQEKIKSGASVTEEEKKFAGMGYEEAVAAGLGRGDIEKSMKGSFSTMEKMTDQLLTETQSFTTTLKNYVGWTLEKIYKLLEYMVSIIPGGEDRAELAKKQEAAMQQAEAVNQSQQKISEEINALATREAQFNASPEDAARLEELRAQYKALDVEKAGLMGRSSAYEVSTSVGGGEVAAKIAEGAAEVGAGGGGTAFKKEQEARNDALTGHLTDMALSGVASALTGGLSMLLPGAGVSLWETVPKAMDTIDGMSSASGTDLLTDKMGLTAEATEESKNTLGQLLLEAKDDGKTSDKEKALLESMLKQMRETEKTKALETLAGIDAEAVSQYLTTGKAEALKVGTITGAAGTDPNVRLALESLGLMESNTESPVDDFIYRGGSSGGVITPINTKDEFLGMKPGGAIDRAARGGSSGTVVININGDTATIVRVVTDVLKKAGLTPSASNGFA